MSEGAGDDFTEFMDIYHGSYDREDGERRKRALDLMEEIINEVESKLARPSH